MPTTCNFFKLDSSIRPGKRIGEPVVTDISALQYNEEELIKYKLNFNENWQEISHLTKRNQFDHTKLPLYLDQ